MEPLVDSDGFDSALERRIFHLKTLYEASQEIGDLREPSQVIQSMLLTLMGALGATSGVMLLAEVNKGKIEVMEIQGCDDALFDHLVHALEGEPLKDFEEACGAMDLDLANRNPNNFGLLDVLSSLGMRLWVPFVVDDELKGGIALGDKLLGEAYTVEDCELLRTLCAQGAVHIANARLIEQLQRRIFHLRTLYDVSQEINFLNDPQEILKRLLLMVAGTFGAFTGMVFLANVKQQKVETLVHQGLETQNLEVIEEMAASGRLLELCGTNRVVNVEDETGESRSNSWVLLSSLQLRVWVPFAINDDLSGGIGLGERLTGESYSPEDHELLDTLAAQGAVCLQNAKLIKQIRKEEVLRTNLSRYISPQLVDQIIKKDLQVNLGGDRKVVTVLFSDIRNFTTITEMQKPDELVSILNEYFTEMAKVIFEHQGSLDKYIGDAIVAVFGSLIPLDNSVKAAVAAATQMMRRLVDLNQGWSRRYGFTIDIGIGISTGEVFLGNIGSPERMEFTVIGDTVNVASRFSALAAPGQILLTREARQRLGDAVRCLQLPSTKVKGKTLPMDVFEVVT
jgi:adenylate cyclase